MKGFYPRLEGLSDDWPQDIMSGGYNAWHLALSVKTPDGRFAAIAAVHEMDFSTDLSYHNVHPDAHIINIVDDPNEAYRIAAAYVQERS